MISKEEIKYIQLYEQILNHIRPVKNEMKKLIDENTYEQIWNIIGDLNMLPHVIALPLSGREKPNLTETDTMKCKQCEEGAKLWKNCTYESLIEEYRETGQSTVDMIYSRLTPFVIYQEHRKYCEKTNKKDE